MIGRTGIGNQSSEGITEQTMGMESLPGSVAGIEGIITDVNPAILGLPETIISCVYKGFLCSR